MMHNIISAKHKPSQMTSRQRVLAALNHQPVDRIPVDLAGTHCSGAQVSVITQLRKALGLAQKGERVKVIDIYQMLGEVSPDLIETLQLDIVMLPARWNMFGFENADWKNWQTFDGTDVLVPGKFNTTPEPNGDILQYPLGDRFVPPQEACRREDFTSMQLSGRNLLTTRSSTLRIILKSLPFLMKMT
jgi:hypothetical protein